ncbi:hypothetical protein ABZS96_25965 [Streptomyces avermitilis]|uniref:hypothetical protein n=1 Tax=Streptomyces avermitilis TaxID=33903 RepID=UPI0033AF0E10
MTPPATPQPRSFGPPNLPYSDQHHLMGSDGHRGGSLRAAAAGELGLGGADHLGEEYERDTRLAAFISARLAGVEATGCTAERNLAAGVREVFTEWSEKRELAATTGTDAFPSQISALGWTLRCFAHHAWQGAPGWERAFHPHVTNPDTIPEIP